MEPTVQVLAAQHLLLIGSVVLAAGTATGFLATRIGIPDIVLFLLVGMALGPAGFGIVDIVTDSTANQLILTFGASYILFDGGVAVRLGVLKKIWITIGIIATVGVFITAGITGAAAYYFLELPAVVALLLGCAIAPTDPATLVPIFKQVKVKDRVMQMAVTESAFNDATGAILTFAVATVALGGSFSLGHAAVDFVREAVIGVVVGGVVGYLICVLIAHERMNFLKAYTPIVTLIVVAAAYLVAGRLDASGFMAVFVAGLVVGNKESFGFQLQSGEQQKLHDFIDTTALIMRMFIFILLGSQVNFGLLGQYWLPSLGVVAIFMFVARPCTVFICAQADRRAKWSVKEMIFMSWTRETGVIPGALAGMLVGARVPHADVIAAVTFVAILATILIQATTTKWLAARLDLLVR